MRENDHKRKPGTSKHVISTLKSMFYLAEDHPLISLILTYNSHPQSVILAKGFLNCKTIMLKWLQYYAMCVFFSLPVKSIEIQGFCSIVGKAVAKHCHFSLIEVSNQIEVGHRTFPTKNPFCLTLWLRKCPIILNRIPGISDLSIKQTT